MKLVPIYEVEDFSKSSIRPDPTFVCPDHVTHVSVEQASYYRQYQEDGVVEYTAIHLSSGKSVNVFNNIAEIYTLLNT